MNDLNKTCYTCRESATCKQKQFNKAITGLCLVCWNPVEEIAKQRAEFYKDLEGFKGKGDLDTIQYLNELKTKYKKE